MLTVSMKNDSSIYTLIPGRDKDAVRTYYEIA